MLSGSDTVKRLNNTNWLRHEIAYTEPRTLFHLPAKLQQPYLDFNCMTNIEQAYDYILNNSNEYIDDQQICQIHRTLCANTNITGGLFRSTNKVIEITVNGQRLHAPDAYEIPYRMNEIIYNLHNSKEGTLERAFNIHYDLIELQPFDDFNKRTARLIMNWVLIQGGYRPIAFNKKADKINYKEALAAAAGGDKKSYRAYMTSALARTQKELIRELHKSKIY